MHHQNNNLPSFRPFKRMRFDLKSSDEKSFQDEDNEDNKSDMSQD